MNENYEAIISKGYQLDVTTGAKNKGTMYLMKNGVRLHSVLFSSHGSGTKAVLIKLPICYRHGSISIAMQRLRGWIEVNQVTELASEPTDSFVALYNDAILKFSHQALSKVHQAQTDNPDLTFEKLFRIWSVEVLYLSKTENKEWVMS